MTTVTRIADKTTDTQPDQAPLVTPGQRDRYDQLLEQAAARAGLGGLTRVTVASQVLILGIPAP